MMKPFLYIITLCILYSCQDRFKEDQPAVRQQHAALPETGEQPSKTLSASVNGKPISSGDHKKHHRKERRLSEQPSSTAKDLNRLPDSLLIEKLKLLRASGVEPDWNEPKTRDYLLTGADAGNFSSMITLSRESFLKISFDNDILDNTDRFYTNGLRLDLIVPALNHSPLGWLMIPYWGRGINYYGISLVQNLYTPSTTKIPGIQYGDRPFASYLYFSTFRITLDKEKRNRTTSELAIGIIGPDSYGDYVQQKFHSTVINNSEPDGWVYQVHNDLVLNYNFMIEHGIIQTRKVDLSVNGSGSLGTLYTNLSGGLHFRAGLLNPYYENLGVSRKRYNAAGGLRNFQFYAFVKSAVKAVGYDATLQGGMFENSSPYTVPASGVSRITMNNSIGLSFIYCGIRADIEQFILSPELKNGYWHKWVHIGLTFCL
jgi:lipid A 3-O-deacylase